MQWLSQLLRLVSYDDHFDHWKSIFVIIIAAITEPLYGYLEDVVSVRPFSLLFQHNRHIWRIDLQRTATSKLQQPRQQRKQENNKKAGLLTFSCWCVKGMHMTWSNRHVWLCLEIYLSVALHTLVDHPKGFFLLKSRKHSFSPNPNSWPYSQLQ